MFLWAYNQKNFFDLIMGFVVSLGEEAEGMFKTIFFLSFFWVILIMQQNN